MATKQSTPVVETATIAESAPQAIVSPSKFMRATQFLSLEHTVRIVLSVMLPLLVLAGISTAFGLWTSTGSTIAGLGGIVTGAVTQGGIGIATALIVLSGLFFIFDRRVRHELGNRANFHHRLGYKLPLYAAFFMTSSLVVLSAINLVATLISSIVLIGTGTDIGGLYLNAFLPTLLGMVVVGFAAWYHYKLLRGVGKSDLFGLVTGVTAIVVALTLIITVAVTSHQSTTRSDHQQEQYKQFFDRLDTY